MSLVELSTVDLAQQLRDGVVTAEQVVVAHLERIEAVDGEIEAWAALDPDYALEQARAVDAIRASGMPCGPLHGMPVGVKDIFDTLDLPTENGTVIDSGRQPTEDAAVVALLKQAGAIIMGKTVTTELACYAPGKTRNPHNSAHTPGGSSSGSAAAVAAHMVPLAIGSQTNGSVIRPAAYCGTVGYKPTHGLISRHGVLPISRQLDTVGVFARDLGGVAMLTDALTAYDARDRDMRPRGRPHLFETASAEPPLDPVFAFAPTPIWDHASEDAREGFSELVDFLGERCDTISLPEPFERAIDWHRLIMCADIAKSFVGYAERGADRLSPTLREMIDEGQQVLAVDYNRAVEWIEVLNGGLDEVFDRYDAILTPATTGEAPAGLESTGSPMFCSLWTLCGVPAVTLPLLEGENGLPIGGQLIGRRGDDGRLLRTARWLGQHIATASDEE